ncbi:MAG: hypothetical protein V1784_09455 [bacterium]
MAINVEIKGKQLVITADIETPTPSKSGKTTIVCSSRGNMATTAQVGGKPVILGFNAYVRK